MRSQKMRTSRPCEVHYLTPEGEVGWYSTEKNSSNVATCSLGCLLVCIYFISWCRSPPQGYMTQLN
jgi:hypothetical protein